MRINLVTPFAEKDAVKALGARWDSTRKLWYIVNVTDLAPFLRWIPNLEAATDNSDAGGAPQMTKPGRSPRKPTKALHFPVLSVKFHTVDAMSGLGKIACTPLFGELHERRVHSEIQRGCQSGQLVARWLIFGMPWRCGETC